MGQTIGKIRITGSELLAMPAESHVMEVYPLSALFALLHVSCNQILPTPV